ncbi:MAG: four-carbon acid sugar kinase family protein [Nakamurella sp.]
MIRIAVIADDLSGAVESAASFLLRTTRIIVTLTARSGSPPELAVDADVQVLDTDSRELTAAASADRAASAAAAVIDVPVVVKKIDSLLRGHIAAELQALRVTRPHLIVAPALPATGRTVRDGRVWVGDQLLHESDGWRAEAGERPLTVAHALYPIPTVVVSLTTVRGPGLAERLHEILAAGTVPVCDALADDDLDRIVAAGDGLDRPILVGSAGITAAVARRLPPSDGAVPTSQIRRSGSLLVVVGSAAPMIGHQLAALTARGAQAVVLHPAELFVAADDEAALVALTARVDGAAAPLVVVAVDATADVDPARARSISRALSVAVSGTAARAAGLVLTGGETARAVLDRIGVTALRPLGEVHHGAVVSVDDAGRLIVTRPGSFGGPTSLLQMVNAAQAALEATAPEHIS